MGETNVDLQSQVDSQCCRERRNGMWNIFDGVDMDNAVLQRLGLSPDLVQALVEGASDDDAVSHCLSQLASSLSAADISSPSSAALSPPASISRSPSASSSSSSLTSSSSECLCRERSRLYRSLSTTIEEEMKAALQNRHRRNAVGDLFEVLTAPQKLLLAETLQAHLQRFSPCCCDNPDSNDSADIVISLSSLLASSTPASSSSSSSASSTSSPSSSTPSSAKSSSSGSPRAQGEIVCR